MENIKDAVYLIDDNSMGQWGNLRTGWDYINDGEGPNSASNSQYWLMNTDKNEELYLRRDCNKFSGGTLTFEVKLENINGNGLYFSFGSRSDAFVYIITKNETLFIGDEKISAFEYKEHFIKCEMNMVSSRIKIFVDAKYCGEYNFNKSAFTFDCLKIGYSKESIGSSGIMFTKLYVNYLVNDYCLNSYIGELSSDYEIKATKGSSVTSDFRVEGKNSAAYISRNVKSAKTITKKSFEKANGIVAFEIKYHMTAKTGKITLALCSKNKALVSVYDEGDELKCYCGSLLRKHSQNVWQTLRIEANTDTNQALIWLNGKKTKTVDFENSCKSADNIKITYEAYEKSQIMFSDILVWEMPKEPTDYVPKPVIPKKNGNYTVGMNICSLWREGSHSGWDCISPYDDLKPVLGYYDEGLPETADWEIKFLAEHGIDYELYCWYSSEANAPLKTTGLSAAIHQGHFHAKYAESMKFALLWEAANCQHPLGLESFKKYLVPYWIDYFFSDPRYMSIDNKAVMSCFGVWAVCNDLGGTENTREGLQYLRDEVKKLGYDDLIIMGCHADPNQLKELGFDAFHAYHWGASGYKLETNINSNKLNIEKNAVHIVPTVSVGFKDIGWGGIRRPNLSCEDMYKGVMYCKDELLPTFEKNSWKSKMLHLSTWNEYGEGTYMMPSGLNGFGYLDAVRAAICEDTPHVDDIPTKEQIERIGYLHVQTRHKLHNTKYDVRPLPKTDTLVAKYEFKNADDMNKWEFVRMSDIEIKDGKLLGKSIEKDPYMLLKDTTFDACKIAYAKVAFTNRDVNGNLTAAHFVVTNRSDKQFNHRENTSLWCGSKEITSYTVELDNKHFWTNTIEGFRFDPITDGGEFQIESISLYAPIPHVTVYGKNNRQLFYEDYLEQRGEEIFIPLDPSSGIYSSLSCKFEWFKEEGRLELWSENNNYTITVGMCYVVKNSENITLVKPIYLKDGIPTIALSDMEKIFGLDCEKINDKVYIK